MVWPEVEQALKNHRYELVLSGEKLKKYLEEKGDFDEKLWSLRQLNFLELSDCSLIVQIPSSIKEFQHLTRLTLTNNRISQLPEEISSLTELRHLNLSSNQLEEIPFDLFLPLDHLETLNLSNNFLKILPEFSNEIHRKFSVMNCSHNQLKDFANHLDNLSHLDLSSNQFEEIPSKIFLCHSLKFLSFEDNHLTSIPSELAHLQKLKEIRFKSNPLKDNRLKKLIEQEKIKATLEYLERHAQQSNKDRRDATTRTTTTTGSFSKLRLKSDGEDRKNLIRILHYDHQPDSKAKQITLLPSAMKVRPHFLSCVLIHLDLKSEGNLKKFLNIQNEIHDGICQKRTLATIGTHDWNSIRGNLVYHARNPIDIALIPLGKGPKILSAKEFYDHLCRDAEHQRKLKKRNQLSGLHKYLTLLENESEFAFLSDEDGHVISLPPLTNADKTKLSPSSETIFVEITSNHSMDICYRVMDLFLHQIFVHQLAENDSQGEFQQILTIQQTRSLDDQGKLRVTYPSRTDLDWKDQQSSNIVIERLFPSDSN